MIGLASAIAVQARGFTTTLLDPSVGHQASWGNAGHLAVEQVEPLARLRTMLGLGPQLFLFGGPVDVVWRDITAWAPWAMRFVAASSPARFAAGSKALASLNLHAIAAWHRLLGTGASELVRAEGHWVVHESEEPDLARTDAAVRVMPGGASRRPMLEPERQALRARLRLPAVNGMRYFGTGNVTDPGLLLDTLAERFVRAGGVRVRGRATGLRREGDGLVILMEDGSTRVAEKVVVAAGVWSRALLQSVDVFAPLIAERGYHIEFRNDQWPADSLPMLFEDHSIFVTRLRDRFRATSYVELGRPESPPDGRKWDRLEARMTAMGLLDGGPTTRWMGARPTLPDYLPAIGRAQLPGLLYATGHGHLGLTQAAITGELVGDLVAGTVPSIDLTPFGLDRFRCVRAP